MRLFAESIELASSDIESYINTDNSINSIDDVLFVVFHAGLGQEASQDFDPTIYDIRSAYIDDDMLSDVQYGQYWINDNNISLSKMCVLIFLDLSLLLPIFKV